jgi:hypothetical protein
MLGAIIATTVSGSALAIGSSLMTYRMMTSPIICEAISAPRSETSAGSMVNPLRMRRRIRVTRNSRSMRADQSCCSPLRTMASAAAPVTGLSQTARKVRSSRSGSSSIPPFIAPLMMTAGSRGAPTVARKSSSLVPK